MRRGAPTTTTHVTIRSGSRPSGRLDLRIDKTFYFRRCMLGIYIDLQNVTASRLERPDVLMSTGVIANPAAPADEQRYLMKYIGQSSGTLIPTLGVTVEF